MGNFDSMNTFKINDTELPPYALSRYILDEVKKNYVFTVHICMLVFLTEKFDQQGMRIFFQMLHIDL